MCGAAKTEPEPGDGLGFGAQEHRNHRKQHRARTDCV